MFLLIYFLLLIHSEFLFFVFLSFFFAAFMFSLGLLPIFSLFSFYSFLLSLFLKLTSLFFPYSLLPSLHFTPHFFLSASNHLQYYTFFSLSLSFIFPLFRFPISHSCVFPTFLLFVSSLILFYSSSSPSALYVRSHFILFSIFFFRSLILICFLFLLLYVLLSILIYPLFSLNNILPSVTVQLRGF